MARRKNKLADRLARLEDASREGMWQLTLEDGTAAALPVLTVMDALAELFGFPVDADQDDDERSSGPPRLTLTHEIRLLARVAEGSETSMLGRTVVALAKEAVREGGA
ncbi:hypothetical protein LK07_10185 [Streptomyces pluripotens]|uniref:Uncharacterized protein n=1 Tax=Streptomyces pluripotens TaxID=1355015 RepID=A0A221NX16_9ACTN|nr:MULTISPECIES: hypothetical protein [Streptomyces]ARP70096.1 hypothetical protein LK06_009075 [Streptomyces pluripotens]ASN24356.1 hypothetical protein LK07_10185 [Streptomyces pluripotens]MCH0559083.1 hypothetical protein [Streptomyces sp. MUM 16J]